MTALLLLVLACGDKDGGQGTAPGDGGISSPDGGTAEGDGGTGDGGSADGGTSDGGTSDGGTADGGTADGGTADGGTEVAMRAVRAQVIGDDLSEYIRAPVEAGATRIVDIYQSIDGDGGEVRLVHDVDEEVWLVLIDYDPVTWVVEETHPGSIQGVMAGCSELSTYALPDGVELESLPSEYFCWGNGAWMDLATRIMELKLEEEGWPAVASLHETYSPAEIRLVPADAYTDDDSLPDCSVPVDPKPFEEPDTSWVGSTCPDLVDQEWVCLTATRDDILLVGRESGATCVIRDNPTGIGRSTDGGNFAWFGTTLLMPGHGGAVTEVPLPDGDYRQSYTYSSGMAADGSSLWVRFDGLHGASYFWDTAYFHAYDSFEDLQCGPGTAVWERPSRHDGDAMTLTADTYFAASHSPDSLELYDRTTGEWQGDLVMGGMDTYLYGLSVVEDEILALWQDDQLVRHDLASGEVLTTHNLGDYVYGLTCARLDD